MIQGPSGGNQTVRLEDVSLLVYVLMDNPICWVGVSVATFSLFMDVSHRMIFRLSAVRFLFVFFIILVVEWAPSCRQLVKMDVV